MCSLVVVVVVFGSHRVCMFFFVGPDCFYLSIAVVFARRFLLCFLCVRLRVPFVSGRDVLLRVSLPFCLGNFSSCQLQVESQLTFSLVATEVVGEIFPVASDVATDISLVATGVVSEIFPVASGVATDISLVASGVATDISPLASGVVTDIFSSCNWSCK